MNWSDQSVLVTGGTGTLGRALVRHLATTLRPKRLVIFSRDELKQFEMRVEDGLDGPQIEYAIGDVRDRRRLEGVCRGITLIVHAAALKQVPTCERDPSEAIATNIEGTRNVISAATSCGARRVLGISTDKAVDPVNLYGATKLCAEKLLVAANREPSGSTAFSCVRYGNVLGSRGSVVPRILRQRASGCVHITDRRMTRFMITPEQALAAVLRSIESMRGGETFVPKIPSVRVSELIEALADGCPIQEVGRRPGERLYEALVSAAEAYRTAEFDDLFVIYRDEPPWPAEPSTGGRPVPPDFSYRSDTNEARLEGEALRRLVEPLVTA